MRWWVARRHEKPTLPYLVEVFKQVYGKTMSSAVLENDFKMTSKMMPSDRNLMSDVFYGAQCMTKCNWEVLKTLPKAEMCEFKSISHGRDAMPPANFGVETYAESDADMTQAANILTSFLNNTMLDCNPDDLRDEEEEERDAL